MAFFRWWRGSSRDRPDLITVALERGIESGGCAVCGPLAERERRAMWLLLWENAMDTATRQQWGRTLGYCARHTNALCAAGARRGMIPGVAMLFVDIARESARRVHAGKPLRVWRDCVECGREAKAEATYVKRLVRHVSDHEWVDRWGASLRVCVRHGASASLRRDAREQLAPYVVAALDGARADEGRSAKSMVAALQDALLGVDSLSGTPAHPRWGCGLCDAEADAAVREGSALLQGDGCVCRRHAALLVAKGAATVEALSEHYAVVARQAREGVALGACPVCTFLDSQGQERVRLWAMEPENSGAALCLRHTEAVLAAAPAMQWDAARFRAVQADALQGLAGELDELFRKSAWDARDEAKGAEQGSWVRAAHCFGYDC